MTDGDLLLAAILANPDDDTARLVYADYLQENGQEDRAEFIRAQVEWARGPAGITCTKFTGDRDGYDCELPPGAAMPPVGGRICARVLSGVGNRHDWFTLEGDCHAYWQGAGTFGFRLTNTTSGWWRPELSARAMALWAQSKWAKFPDLLLVLFQGFRRGFLESLTCTAADWFEHGDDLRAAHPLRKVRLTSPCPQMYVHHTNGEGEPLTLAARVAGRDVSVDHVPLGGRETTLAVLGARWPGVKFELPAPATNAGLYEAPDAPTA